MKPINQNLYLGIGIALEALILAYCYVNFDTIGEVFRHAARYSGRLSLLVYLFAFYFFATNGLNQDLKKIITIFCILHFIHFGFLALNVYLNQIELVPIRLLGGFLAYLIILLYPFIFDKHLSKVIPYIYFYYVGIVMALTYVARLKNGFEGASPTAFHYFGLISVIIAFVVFGFMLFRKTRSHIH